MAQGSPHFVTSSDDDDALRRGLQGLGIRLAKAINRLFNRAGKVFRERFHARGLHDFKALKNAVRYALQNARKHGVPIPPNEWDPYSSARYNKCLIKTPQSTWPISFEKICILMHSAYRLVTPEVCPGPRYWS